MTASDSKRMIVIKNIPSNLVEEAILILKQESSAKYAANTDAKNDNKFRDALIIKEAEMIVNNYEKECKQKAKQKYFWKNSIRSKTTYLINFLLICGVLMLATLIWNRFF